MLGSLRTEGEQPATSLLSSSNDPLDAALTRRIFPVLHTRVCRVSVASVWPWKHPCRTPVLSWQPSCAAACLATSRELTCFDCVVRVAEQ